MDTIFFIAYLLLGFLGMEAVSYLSHRFLFHGALWFIHKTHHTPRRNLFEWNDLFSLIFAAISILLIFEGTADPLHSPSFGIGLGIALYGMSYFMIHDILIHKRFLTLSVRHPFIRKIKRAHQQHHQSIQKSGKEPYGLFLFNKQSE